MSIETRISLDECLSTSCDSDLEYRDGVLLDRNVGGFFALRRKYPTSKVLPELRSKVKKTRYRLPGVCVPLTKPGTTVIATENPRLALTHDEVFQA